MMSASMRGTEIRASGPLRTAPTGRTHDCKRHLHHAPHDLLQSGGHPHMNRRDLLALAAGAAAALRPLAAIAQQSRRIGFLSSLSADAQEPQLAALRRGLEEIGYTGGRNLVVEYRWANGDYGRLPRLIAAKLVRGNVEVIAAGGGPSPAMAAMQATTTIPIVSSTVGPSAVPFVKRFNRPEGNLTAVSLSPFTGPLLSKRLQILAEMVPGATIGVR